MAHSIIQGVSGARDRVLRLPVLGDVAHVSGAVVSGTLSLARSTTRAVVATAVRELVEIVTTEVDVTAFLVDTIDLNALLERVDLNRVLGGVDLDALLGAVDLNALLDTVNLNALLAKVDLDALLADVDMAALLERIDLDAVLARLDVMAVIDRVDLDTVVSGVDLNRVMTLIDLDAVVHQIDLIPIANEIIDGVDLPAIIRDASTSVTSDVMVDVRSTGERADDAVANAINRVLRRRKPEATGDGDIR